MWPAGSRQCWELSAALRLCQRHTSAAALAAQPPGCEGTHGDTEQGELLKLCSSQYNADPCVALCHTVLLVNLP